MGIRQKKNNRGNLCLFDYIVRDDDSNTGWGCCAQELGHGTLSGCDVIAAEGEQARRRVASESVQE